MAPTARPARRNPTMPSRSPREHGRVGKMLREWRRKRRLTQQDVAEAAEVSTRHLSCVETGKAQPSREMLLVLGSALELPLRERNLLLRASGHPPAYPETDLQAPDMAPIRQTLEMICRSSEPNPVIVADGGYDLVQMNASMVALAMWLGVPAFNLIEVVFTGLKPFIVNWDEVAAITIDRLHREVLHTGDARLVALYERVAPMAPTPGWDVPPVAMPVRIQKDDIELVLFTALTSLGTATDVTAAELRIETYYPMNEETRAALADLTEQYAPR